MGSVVIYSFDDQDHTLEGNESYYEWNVDFGEAGEIGVSVDVDCIIDSCVISASVDSVTIDTGHLASELVNQGELEDILRDLCNESSLDEVFDLLVTLSPDYSDE